MPDLHILRITLELLSPLSIGTGRPVSGKARERRNVETGETVTEAVQAAAIIRAANGLPGIPGSAWQGAVRRLARKEKGETWANAVLGFETSGPDGQAGRVTCGWGGVHDSADKAVPEAADIAASDDPIIRLLRSDAPVWRDHVALTHKHGPDGAKKFARSAVPAGTRFSIEASIWGDTKAANDLVALLSLFRHPDFRLGSARNRGYGRVKVVRASRQAFTLDDPRAIRDARKAPASKPLKIDLLNQEEVGNVFDAPQSDRTVFSVVLQARDFLRIGAATDAAISYTKDTKGARKRTEATAWNPGHGSTAWDADGRSETDNVLRLLTEARVLWTPNEHGEKGQVVDPLDVPQDGVPLDLPLPGSALGGQLSHRTVYWWNKATRTVISVDDADRFDTLTPAEQQALLARVETMGQRPSELVPLFGTAKAERADGATGSPGQAGALRVEDAVIASDWVMRLDHASIDRFTGGVRDRTGALFSEEVLVRPTIRAELSLPLGTAAGDSQVGGYGRTEATAFLHALKDLCTGRLPVGARSLGTCTGYVGISGPDAGAWRTAAEEISLPLTAEQVTP